MLTVFVCVAAAWCRGPGDGASGVCVKNSASVCMQYNWSPNWFSLAADLATPVNNPPAWSEIQPGNSGAGVQLTFNNGLYGPNAVTTVVQFLCGTNTEPVYTASLDSNYRATVTVTGSQACPASPPSPVVPYPCAWTAPNGAHYDFSSLRSASGVAVPGSNSDVFDVNVCGAVQGNAACTNANATVCMQYSWSPTWFALAEYNSNPAPIYSLIDPSASQGGVQLTFQNGLYGPQIPTVNFQFLCGDNSEANYTALSNGNNVWTITLTAKGACGSPVPVPPSPSPSGLGCTYTSPDGSHFDFSGLHTAQATSFKGSADDVYLFNMCGPITGAGSMAPPACVAGNASLCLQFSWSPNWFVLAEWELTPLSSPPSYALITPGQPAKGVVLSFSNGAYGPNPVWVGVQLLCGSTAEPIYAESHDNTYHWTVQITSSLCCPTNAKQPGASSVMLPPSSEESSIFDKVVRVATE